MPVYSYHNKKHLARCKHQHRDPWLRTCYQCIEPVPDVLYRIEARWYEEWYDAVKLRLERYKVIKATPCGHWINDYGRKRWVSATSRKRFAHPTVEEALAAYIKRKTSYVGHCKARLKTAEAQLAAADGITAEELITQPYRIIGGLSCYND